MDDMPGEQSMAAGDFGAACRAAAEGAALGQQSGAGGAMNGPVDSAAAEEGLVGGVDDGIDIEAGDVALNYFYSMMKGVRHESSNWESKI